MTESQTYKNASEGPKQTAASRLKTEGDDERAYWDTVRCTNCKEEQRYPSNATFTFECRNCHSGGHVKVEKEFDYLDAAQKIAMVFRNLAEFETPGHAIVSPTMDKCKALAWSMTTDQFYVSLGLALSFNVQPVAADNTLDDVSDAYLGAHADKKKEMDEIVKNIEALTDQDKQTLADDDEGMKG